MPKKLIPEASMKPGALRRQEIKDGEIVPTKKRAPAAAKGGKAGQRARVAQTLGKLKSGKATF